MAFAYLEYRGLFLLADLHAMCAAGTKTAALRRSDQVRRSTRNGYKTLFLGHIDRGQALQQSLCVRMGAAIEDIFAGTGLNDLASDNLYSPDLDDGINL